MSLINENQIPQQNENENEEVNDNRSIEGSIHSDASLVRIAMENFDNDSSLSTPEMSVTDNSAPDSDSMSVVVERHVRRILNESDEQLERYRRRVHATIQPIFRPDEPMRVERQVEISNEAFQVLPVNIRSILQATGQFLTGEGVLYTWNGRDQDDVSDPESIASDNDDNRGNWVGGLMNWMVSSLKGMFSFSSNMLSSAMNTVINGAVAKLAGFLGFDVTDNTVRHLLFAIACAFIYVVCKTIGAPPLVAGAAVSVFALMYGPSLPAKIVAVFASVLPAGVPMNSVNVNVTPSMNVVYHPQGAGDIAYKLVVAGVCLFLSSFIPVEKSWDHFMTRCDKIPKAIRGVQQMSEMLESLFKTVDNEVSFLLGGPRKPDLVFPDEVITNFENVTELSKTSNLNLITTDPSIRARIEAEYHAFYRMRRAYAGNREVQTFLDKYGGMIGSLMSRAASATPGVTNNRQKPVVAFFQGGTGVGKSELLYFIGVDALNHLGLIGNDDTDEQIKAKINGCMYARYIEQEYWDAYASQPLCLFDDMFQMRDSMTNPNLEYMELIRSANRFPYALHMAELGQKACSFFSSKFILATTNVNRIDPVSIVDKQAVASRVDFGFNVSVKEEYQVNPNGTTEMDHRIDRNKVAHFEQPSLDIYEFKEWNPLTGAVSGAAIPYSEMIVRLIRKYELLKREHERSNDGYVSYARVRQAAPLRVSLQGNTLGSATNAYSACVAEARRYLAYVKQYYNALENHPALQYTAKLSFYALGISMVCTIAASYLLKQRKHYDENTQWVLKNKDAYMGACYIMHCLGPATVSDILWKQDERYVKLVQAEAETSLPLVKAMHIAMANYYSISAVNCVRTESYLALLVASEIGIVMSNLWMNVIDKEFALYVVDAEVYQMLKEHQSALRALRKSGAEDLKNLGVKVPTGHLANVAESGREVPKNASVGRMESGRDLPRSAPVGRMESGKDVPKGVPVARMESSFKTEAFSSKQAMEVIYQLRPNFFLVEYDGSEATVFAIGGRKFLINRHYWLRFQNATELRLKQYRSQTSWEFTIAECIVQEPRRDPGQADMLIVTFPRRIAPQKKVFHHFLAQRDLAKLKRKPVVMLTPSFDGETWKQSSGEITDVQFVAMDQLDNGRFETKKATAVFSTVRSQDGDCGGIYVVDDDNFNKRVVGFHYGGLQTGGALAVPLVFEDFDEIMAEEYCVILPKEVLPEAASPVNRVAVLHGRVEHAPPASIRTQLERTPIHGKVQETTVAPCQLGRLLAEDGPGLRGLAKVGGMVPKIDDFNLEKAKESFKSILFTGRELVEKRVLSFEEAVKGVDDEPLMKGINRTRSAGYPWSLESTNGKRHWFGSEEWEVDTPAALEVKSVIEERISGYKERILIPALYTDTLKDETRPLEKVAAGKTRVFSAAPMHLIILVRMYFLSFFAYVMKNKNFNEVSVGTSAQSLDWDMLARKLKQKGNRMIAGDFSNYDGTLHPDILYTVCDIVNEWYNDEFSDIRKCIFEDIVHSWHVSEREVTGWSHSQPSGNPGTAIFNSIYNSLVMRLVYYKLESENVENMQGLKLFDTFNKAVSMVSYGDDNLLSVSFTAPWYNPVSVSEAMKAFGMVYTSEDKTEMGEGYRSLEEVSYLKRGFRFEPKIAAWVAPLQRNSINERLNWQKKTGMKYEILQQNMEGAIAEWALHDEETFEYWADRIQNAAGTVNLYVSKFQQAKYLESVRAGKYAEDFPMLTFA